MVSQLYPYQIQGINQIKSTERFWLLDDMGLGKTVQFILGVEGAMNNGTILIICPASLKYNWAAEINKWSTKEHTITVVDDFFDFRMLQITNYFNTINPKCIQYLITDYSWYSKFVPSKKTTSTYNMANLEMYCKMVYKWSAVILDEAHKLRGKDSAMTQVIMTVINKANRLYIGTGTPLMNEVSDIWPLLKMTWPDKFGNYHAFTNLYCDVEKTKWGVKISDKTDKNDTNIKQLRTFIEKNSLRRLKTEVLPDLPQKTISVVPIQLVGDQYKQYKSMEKDFFAQLESGKQIITNTVVAQMMRLRQLALSADLFNLDSDKLRGAKIDALMDFVEGYNNQIVIFTTFKSVVKKLATMLPSVQTISGESTAYEKQSTVDSFQNGNFKTLIGTTESMYQGFTLTAASTAIFLDKGWLPEIQRQAQDRLLRIGQKNAVMIYEYMAISTLDEYIECILQNKSASFSTLFNYSEVTYEDKTFLNLLLEQYKRRQ